MSIFHQIPKELLREEGFTHKAWAFGFVPVWVGAVDQAEDGDLLMTTRNWVPEWLLDTGELFYNFYCTTAASFDPLWESPGFPVCITGELPEW